MYATETKESTKRDLKSRQKVAYSVHNASTKLIDLRSNEESLVNNEILD